MYISNNYSVSDHTYFDEKRPWYEFQSQILSIEYVDAKADDPTTSRADILRSFGMNIEKRLVAVYRILGHGEDSIFTEKDALDLIRRVSKDDRTRDIRLYRYLTYNYSGEFIRYAMKDINRPNKFNPNMAKFWFVAATDLINDDVYQDCLDYLNMGDLDKRSYNTEVNQSRPHKQLISFYKKDASPALYADYKEYLGIRTDGDTYYDTDEGKAIYFNKLKGLWCETLEAEDIRRRLCDDLNSEDTLRQNYISFKETIEFLEEKSAEAKTAVQKAMNDYFLFNMKNKLIYLSKVLVERNIVLSFRPNLALSM